MNCTPRGPAQAALPHPSRSPEQRLAASRLQIAQALRQSAGLLLLQRLLASTGSLCDRTSKAAAADAAPVAAGAKSRVAQEVPHATN